MSFTALTTSFPWGRYSRKLKGKIDKPRSAGFFSAQEAAERGLSLKIGEEGILADGNCVRFYWLLDHEDGVILDARFQLFGQTALIGAAEAACELLIGKNYQQARRLTTDLIDRQLRDRADVPAFPRETYPHLNLILGAIDKAAEACGDIPVAEIYQAPPKPINGLEGLGGEGDPAWTSASQTERIGMIEDVLDRDIRPYIALDGGGVELVDFKEGEVHIRYQGNCTSCYSSVGATLSYIQEVLRAKLERSLVVIPDLSQP